MLDFLDLDEIEPLDYDIDYNEYSITTKPDDEHVTDVKDMSDLIEFIDIYMDKYIKKIQISFHKKNENYPKTNLNTTYPLPKFRKDGHNLLWQT